MPYFENLNNQVIKAFLEACSSIFGVQIDPSTIQLSPTKKEFTGDLTIVLFPYIRDFKVKPEEAGAKLGAYMQDNVPEIIGHNTIKGFLNLEVSKEFWSEGLRWIANQDNYGCKPSSGEKVMVEFASPNTNKPLHLGHIRNILLGWSMAKIMQANGHEVIKTQIVNDRGIAICKSMLAWKRYGNGETPSTAKVKGDHFVGNYYVLFETKFQEEYKSWQQNIEGKTTFSQEAKEGEDEASFYKRYKNTYFNEYSILGKEAKVMLLSWENNDPDTVLLWEKMNQWVYDGFDITYEHLGVNFDSIYYESDTYLLGKQIVEQGLTKGIFEKETDGSVWIDLTEEGMDRKIVLRSDGTSVYITQDMGTAQIRYQDTAATRMIYVVADEQDYHFKVLFEIAKKLGEPYAEGLYHLSYGMVDLPTGRMKSREGTVVDADDLIQEVINEAKEATAERGEIEGMSTSEKEDLYRMLGLAALKFFMLKVGAKKRMTFDPKSSVDMQGQTGPYIQNAYVRVQSMLRKLGTNHLALPTSYTDLVIEEIDLIKLLAAYPEQVSQAATQYDPSIIANYCYQLAKDFHRYYHDVRILGAPSEEAKLFRLSLSNEIAKVLARGMDLLGIEMPSRM